MEDLKKEWQEFVERQVWQGEDEFTKNMGVGNVADWWIEKFSSRQISLIKMIVEMVESEKKELPRNFDCGYTENKNYNQALDTISSKLKELIK